MAVVVRSNAMNRAAWLSASIVALLSTRAHAHTPREQPVMMAPERWMLVDAQLRALTWAQQTGPWEAISEASAPIERVAYVCSDRALRCFAVTSIERCDPQQQPCSAETIRVRFGGAPVRWRSDGVIQRIEERPPPDVNVTPPSARGEGCDGEDWVWAAHVTAGVEFAWDPISARLGAVFSPGLRRLAANGAHRERITGVRGECGEYGPAHAEGTFAAVIGTEYGVDFRGHILGAFVPGEAAVGVGGIVPIGRVQLRRWRLPSVLGALLPEVGYQMRAVSADPMGPRAGKSDTLWALYLRPAGWAVSYVFARRPEVSVTLDAAPVFAVPLSGQAFSLGFSAWISLEMSAW